MTRALILDTSFYEDNPDTPRHIDYAKMKSAGVSGVIVRAGQREWVDSSLIQSWIDTKRAGLPRGSYWFYDSRDEPIDQANLWFNTMKQLGDFGELPLFADYEEGYGGDYKGGVNFKLFIEALQSLMPGKEISIYTGYYYWKDNMPASLRPFFAKFPLWIAYYGTNAPYIPEPWTDWTFWQYSENGNGNTYGTEGEVDLNWYNGTHEEFVAHYKISEVPIIVEPEPVKTTITHEGVTLHEMIRFGAHCFVHVIDTSKAQVEVSDCGFRTPSYVAQKYGAQVVTNGGGWPNKQDATHRSNEMWAVKGFPLQMVSAIKDNRPYVNVRQDGTVEVSPDARMIPGLYHALGFDRILLWEGQYNSKISDNFTKDARTASGVTTDGKLVILSVEGNDYYQRGLTFKEMANVLLEFGVTHGGNNDGGSSTNVVNTAIKPGPMIIGSDGEEAPVINHWLVFAKPLGEQPIEEKKMYEVKVDINIRPTPSVYATATGIAKAGTKFDSTTTHLGINPLKPSDLGVTFIQLPSGGWIPMIYRGTTYVEKINDTPPVPEIVTRVIKINTATGEVQIDGGEWL